MDRGDQIASQFKSHLDTLQIEYDFLEHEPTPTSEDSSRIRGTPLNEGAKALILRTSKGINVMAVLSGDKKIDSKKLKAILNDSFSFENPEVILERYGLIIGGVPPFGAILGIKTYYDNSILKNSKVSFNCGTKTKSIDMKVEDFAKAVEGEWMDFSA